MLRDVVTALVEWAAEGRPAAVCAVTAVHGSAPMPVGTLMAVCADGRVAGAVSGGCVEAEVIETARRVARGASGPAALRFAPGDDPLTSRALPCGGGIDVHVEAWTGTAEQAAFAAAVLAGAGGELQAAAPGVGVLARVPPRPRLVLVGGGLVAGALCGLAPLLGAAITVVDPREAFLARSGPGLDGAEAVLAAWPREALAQLAPLGPADALVALSHHPALDDEALALALPSACGHVGVLGSRRTHRERLARLRERGLAEADLARLAGPVGLDLGGSDPGEVALAIAAELVAVRHGRAGGRLVDAAGPIRAAGGRAPRAATHAAAPAGRPA